MNSDRTKRVPDVPLSFFWKAARSVDSLLVLPPARTKKITRAMAAIALAAIVEAPSGRRISYSRRRQFYSVPSRYRRTDYTYDAVIPAVELLVKAEILVDHVIAPSGPRGSGWQSSFLPSPRLLNLDLGRVEQVLGETIRLKNSDGRLVDYKETKATRADRARMRRINQALSQHRVEITPEAGGVLQGDVMRFPASGDRGAYAVNLRRVDLYRVFSGGWTLGGRLYGAWYQSVRSSARSCLLIDGRRVAEVDYRCLHGHMLYAHAGLPFHGDVYAVPGQERAAVKAMFNISLNATSRVSARLAFLADEDFSHWSGKQAERLITAILRHHAPVAHLMNTGLGLRFQFLDAVMAMEIVEEMAVRRGVGCLPVHDSFLVPAEHVEELVAVMSEVFHRALPGCGDPGLKIKLGRELDGGRRAESIPHREGGLGVGSGSGGWSPRLNHHGGSESDSTRIRVREVNRPRAMDDPGYWAAVEASLEGGVSDGSFDCSSSSMVPQNGSEAFQETATLPQVPGRLAPPKPVLGTLTGSPEADVTHTETNSSSESILGGHVGASCAAPKAYPTVREGETASGGSETVPMLPCETRQPPALPDLRRVRRPAFLDRVVSMKDVERAMVAERAAAPLSHARKPLRLKPIS